MKRELQAFCVGFTWPVLVFILALGVAVWLTSPVFGDDFDDHLAALKAQNAAAKPHDHADPFAAKNAAYTHRYESDYGGRYICDCGCIEGGPCGCKNCCSPAKTRRADERPAAANPPGCKCPEGSCNCWTGEDCGADCAFGGKKPKEGATRCPCIGPDNCTCPGGPGGGSCLCASCSEARREGATRPADDGGADWRWTNAEGGYWWRYAATPTSAYYAPPAYYQAAPHFFAGVSCGSGG